MRAPFLSVSREMSHIFYLSTIKFYRLVVTKCLKCYTILTSPTILRCQFMRISHQAGRILWITNYSTTAWFRHVPPDLTREYGKYLWSCGKTWMEEDVLWEMHAAILQMQKEYSKCSPKTSKGTIPQIGKNISIYIYSHINDCLCSGHLSVCSIMQLGSRSPTIKKVL